LSPRELGGLIAENKLLQEQLALNKAEREQILVRIKKDYQKNRKQLSRLKKNEKQLKLLVSRLEEVTQTEVVPKITSQSFIKQRGKVAVYQYVPD
jgi:septal ring factor EnvC (AmiA/AmiB activator)